ncbi:MAG TPA: nucleotidyltransferase family protein [bacterium]|nr:nucleotidyltransferase family protein [bacterium]HPJ71230.1 nucleotidyltransferase family protein [bacterium]
MKKPPIVVLCGGKGVRIRDYSGDIPKPLIPLGNKSILELSLEQYYAQGFRDYLFCVGYRGEMIREKFQSWRGARCRFDNAGEDASMLKRIHAVRNQLTDDFIVVYGDTVNKVDLNELCRAHRRSDKLMTMVVSRLRIPFGLIEKQGDTISRFREKPEFDYYIGTLAVDAEIFNFVSEDMLRSPDSKGLLELFHRLIERGEVGTYSFEGLQITFNTPLEHTTAEQQLTHYYTYIEGETT